MQQSVEPKIGDKMQTEFKELATASPGKFLYEVYRDGPLANLTVHLVWFEREKHLRRTWALEPAEDGLRAMFDVFAADGRRSLRRAINDFKKEATSHRYVKQVDRKTIDGRVVKINEVDLDALTPGALLGDFAQAIRLEKALAARGEVPSERREDVAFCEKVLAPLLQAMPSHKSAAQYPKA